MMEMRRDYAVRTMEDGGAPPDRSGDEPGRGPDAVHGISEGSASDPQHHQIREIHGQKALEHAHPKNLLSHQLAAAALATARAPRV